MTNIASPSQTILIACSLLILSACGGGGGGGGATPGPVTPNPPAITVPTAEYSGVDTPATLTKDNAANFAGGVVGALTLVALADAAWIPVAGATGEISETQAGPEGGTAIVTGSLNAGVGTLEIEYTDFRAAGSTLNGRVVQRSTSPTTSSSGFVFLTGGPGEVGFDNLTVATPEGTIVLQGSVAISGGNGQTVDLDLALTETDTNEVAYFENFSVDYSNETDLSRLFIGVSFSGRLFDGTQGYVDVASVTPFVNPLFIDEPGFTIAQSGEFTMQAEGGDVTLTALSLAFAALGIDNDGDSNPDEFLRMSWPALADLALNEPIAVTGPVANTAGVSANLTETATLDGRFSHDNDGDWLTLTWRLLAKPLESTYDPGTFNAGSFTFTPDVEGDYLFELTASDGQSDTRMGVTVRANPTTVEPMPNRNRVGGLEFTPPIMVGVPTLIDGRAAGQNIHGDFPPDWFVRGDGAEVVTEQPDPFIAEYVTDTPGLKTIQLDARVSQLPQFSAFTELDVFVGRNVPSLKYELVGAANGRDLVVADYNGDGRDDLVVRQLAAGVDNLLVLLADANGGHTLMQVGTGPSDGIGGPFDSEITTGDLNNDGRLDIVVGGAETIQIHYQGEAGIIDNVVDVPLPDDVCFVTSNNPGDVGVGDINGDGLDDLAAVVVCDRSVANWLQQTDGTLRTPQVQFAGQVSFVTFEDANDDGRMDVLYGGSTNSASEAVIALGDQAGFFIIDERIPLPLSNGPLVTSGDVNGDGLRDIIVRTTSRLLVLARQMDGSLTQIVEDSDPISLGAFRGRVALADIDEDGLVDFVFCASRQLATFFQQPDFSLEHVILGECENVPFGERSGVVFYDYDGDGVRDVIVAGGPGRPFPSTQGTLLTILFSDLKPYATP